MCQIFVIINLLHRCVKWLMELPGHTNVLFFLFSLQPSTNNIWSRGCNYFGIKHSYVGVKRTNIIHTYIYIYSIYIYIHIHIHICIHSIDP